MCSSAAEVATLIGIGVVGLMWRGMLTSVGRLVLATAVAALLIRVEAAEWPHPPIPTLDWERRSDWKSVKDAGAVGGKDCSDHREPSLLKHGIVQTGTAPVELYLFGNTFYGTALQVMQPKPLRVFLLSNETLPAPTFVRFSAADTDSPDAVQALLRALDALRRLGEIVLRLNHPDMN